MFVEETVVVELKSVQSLLVEHEVQLVNYLKGLKKDIGLLINFSPSGVDVKRKYREFDRGEISFFAAGDLCASGALGLTVFFWKKVKKNPKNPVNPV